MELNQDKWRTQKKKQMKTLNEMRKLEERKK